MVRGMQLSLSLLFLLVCLIDLMTCSFFRWGSMSFLVDEKESLSHSFLWYFFDSPIPKQQFTTSCNSATKNNTENIALFHTSSYESSEESTLTNADESFNSESETLKNEQNSISSTLQVRDSNKYFNRGY